MSPPVFIVDTSVVVAGMLTDSRQSPVAQALDAMLAGTLIFLMSPALLDEYRAVLLRPTLAKLHALTEAEIDQLLVELTANAIWREPGPASPAPDPGDDHLWALLRAYPGSLLVTGDRLLLQNAPKQGSVISPATWLGGFAAAAGPRAGPGKT
ncbi:MAG: PIN domain-containing protein [Gammaproteobacteria bacterium]|nr:MAG: PIN domain-containing protein [Gammaproteobacteria bacterium]